jgi:hypothetical protein
LTELPGLTAQLAARFADVALANVDQEYPHKLDHVIQGDADALPPRVLHPAFHASYDWHSCVHMHWLLVHLHRRFPDLPQRARIEAVCDMHLSAAAITGECAYLARPDAQSFERTYGWAWLLKLATELARCTDAPARRWCGNLQPLAEAMVERYRGFLPKADYPIRYGMHANSAFGLAFALDYARAAGDVALARACIDKALAWFGNDRDAPARWEPSGADFLSPALMEAALMTRVLDAAAFARWLAMFLPGLVDGEPATLFTPVTASDRADPQIVHLDGLNLSRAWCWRELAAALPAGDERAARAGPARDAHLAAGLDALSETHFVGTHWLASFAVLALGG